MKGQKVPNPKLLLYFYLVSKCPCSQTARPPQCWNVATHPNLFFSVLSISLKHPLSPHMYPQPQLKLGLLSEVIHKSVFGVMIIASHESEVDTIVILSVCARRIQIISHTLRYPDWPWFLFSRGDVIWLKQFKSFV